MLPKPGEAIKIRVDGREQFAATFQRILALLLQNISLLINLLIFSFHMRCETFSLVDFSRDRSSFRSKLDGKEEIIYALLVCERSES